MKCPPFERGQAKVVIDTVLLHEEIGKAHERLDPGHGRGKITLQVERSSRLVTLFALGKWWMTDVIESG